MKTYYIVWNPSRTEGYITDEVNDAEYASTGLTTSFGTSTLADALRDAYLEDGDAEGGVELPLQVVEL